LERFIELKMPGLIFLNYGANALATLVQDWQPVLPRLEAYGFALQRTVVVRRSASTASPSPTQRCNVRGLDLVQIRRSIRLS
jgi:hypothetical protein